MAAAGRLADRGVAGPVVDVDQDRAIGGGEDGVAAVGFEAERRGGPPGHRLERGELERQPADTARRRQIGMEERGARNAVELDDRTPDVGLDGHRRDAPLGEGIDRPVKLGRRHRHHVVRPPGRARRLV